jgi:hypothetical protein
MRIYAREKLLRTLTEIVPAKDIHVLSDGYWVQESQGLERVEWSDGTIAYPIASFCRLYLPIPRRRAERLIAILEEVLDSGWNHELEMEWKEAWGLY